MGTLPESVVPAITARTPRALVTNSRVTKLSAIVCEMGTIQELTRQPLVTGIQRLQPWSSQNWRNQMEIMQPLAMSDFLRNTQMPSHLGSAQQFLAANTEQAKRAQDVTHSAFMVNMPS